MQFGGVRFLSLPILLACATLRLTLEKRNLKMSSNHTAIRQLSVADSEVYVPAAQAFAPPKLDCKNPRLTFEKRKHQLVIQLGCLANKPSSEPYVQTQPHSSPLSCRLT